MARYRSHSVEFKRQVAQEYLGGETLHGLARRHYVSRNLVRVWVGKSEAGACDEDTNAADLLQACPSSDALRQRRRLASGVSGPSGVEIGLALLSDAWAGAEHWEPQADPDLTLDQLLRRAEVVTVGIDGGGLDDLLGLSVIGRDAITRDWLLWSRAWAHPVLLERRKSEAARMQDFARDGDLRTVGRLGEDVEEVADIVADIDRAGLLHAVGLDPVGIGGIVDALAERHITGDRVVGIPQGWPISGAIKKLERRLADGTLWHPGQSLMAWCVGNARVEPRGNAITITITITKQAAGKAKIDPLVAAFNAAELMSRNPEARSAPAVFLL